MIFKGSGVALITPFDDNNNIDFLKLGELIEFQIANYTDAIIVCGTTGESANMVDAERKEVIKFTIDKVNKRVPVIVGSGSNNTSHSCKLSEYSEMEGADGLLLVTPYYNKCSQEGLYLHYKTIANSVTLPIILYNVPTRTCVNLEPQTVKRLSEISNIVGLKEASNNISQITEIFSLINDDFDIYSGNDDQILPILSLGGKGVISVVANILPYEMHRLCYSFFEGYLEESKAIQLQYYNLIRNLFIEVNPAPIKEAMNYLGYNVGNCRLPLCNISDKNKEILINSMKELKM